MLEDRTRRALPTGGFERRLIRLAARGDHAAQTQLLRRYEPMVRWIARPLYLPGGEREDLAQIIRLAVLSAASAWDPHHGVPFRSFACLCAAREARTAITSAHSGKHEILNTACALDRDSASSPSDGTAETSVASAALEVSARSDEDPVAKTIARDERRAILARCERLSDLERGALARSLNDCSHRQIAADLQIGVRAVNNALQRARHKLTEPVNA